MRKLPVNSREGFSRQAGQDRGVIGVSAMRPRHAEDAVPRLEVLLSCWSALDDTREIYSQHEWKVRSGCQQFNQLVVNRVDPRMRHADEIGIGRGGNRQVMDRRGFTEAADCKSANVLLLFLGEGFLEMRSNGQHGFSVYRCLRTGTLNTL